MLPGVPGSETGSPPPVKKKGGPLKALHSQPPPVDDPPKEEAGGAPALQRVGTMLADQIMGAKGGEHEERKAKPQAAANAKRKGPR